jgi:hypothetical protein
MNLPSISHRPGVHVRLRHACPRCDGPHVQRLPPVSIHREHDWYECEDCQHVWRYVTSHEARQRVGRTMTRSRDVCIGVQRHAASLARIEM